MAYVQTCLAGFPMPAGRSGRFEVCGFKAAVKDPTAASRVVLWDDSSIPNTQTCGKVYLTPAGPGITVKAKISETKGLANGDANLEHCFPEPIKTRYGVSIYTDNVVSVELYVR